MCEFSVQPSACWHVDAAGHVLQPQRQSRPDSSICSTEPQVLATNEAVFGAIADTFASLTAAVLPAYRVRLRKVRMEARLMLLPCLPCTLLAGWVVCVMFHALIGCSCRQLVSG